MRSLFTDIFKQQGKWVKIYVGKEIVDDPYEKNVTITNINPIPVLAIIEDLTTTQAQWKIPGVKTSKVKELLIESKHRVLMEQSSKIEISGELYEGWRESGKMQMREDPGPDRKSYLRLYVYTKVG